MSRHSNLIGGSTADRLLNCPGSFQLIQRIPEMADRPSEYANYGSAMHAVMDRLVESYADGFPTSKDHTIGLARELLGETFYDRVLEQHHLDDSIIPAIDTLYELMRIYGGGFAVVANELNVKFPSIPGAYGTCDLILANKKVVLMNDWKFGAGIPVTAVIKDDTGERVNPQLLFYFAAAINSLPSAVFKKKKYAVAIIQPRTDEPLTHTIITRTEIDMFVEDVDVAIIKALDKDPPLTVGDHCRWCPARPFCPRHTEPLFELTQLGAAPARPLEVDTDDGDYGEFLAKAKVLVDLAADYKKAVDEQLHAYLEAGGTVPGWKLKLKTKLRQWVDEGVVIPTLVKLGFTEPDILQHKLQTFAHVDKVAKRLGVKIPDHLRVAPETDETVIAPESDPAPKIDRKQAALEFSQALKELRHGT
jgi:hypothetical protein